MIGESLGEYTNASRWCYHSYEVQNLIKGRVLENLDEKSGKQYKLPSLLQLGNRLNHIWGEVKNDDPYAEMTLIEIERLIDRAHKALDRQSNKLKKRLKNSGLPEGIDIVINVSKNTLAVSLEDVAFRTTHAKQLIIVLARYDIIMRTITTYKEFGFISDNYVKPYRFHLTKVIRAIFMEILRYKKTGVTRHDFLNSSLLAKSVSERMGMLPFSIIDRSLSSRWGPNVDANVKH